jgi:hypothetical protein
MSYSTLYGNQAREKIGINPYEELRAVLKAIKNQDVYIISVPRNFKVPKKNILDSVNMDDCIDVMVEGEANARRLARDWAKRTQEHIVITRYNCQPIAKLQSELDVAKTIAIEQGKQILCYTDIKREAQSS